MVSRRRILMIAFESQCLRFWLSSTHVRRWRVLRSTLCSPFAAAFLGRFGAPFATLRLAYRQMFPWVHCTALFSGGSRFGRMNARFIAQYMLLNGTEAAPQRTRLLPRPMPYLSRARGSVPALLSAGKLLGARGNIRCSIRHRTGEARCFS